MPIRRSKEDLRYALSAKCPSPVREGGVRTEVREIDRIAPDGLFRGGAVHELLWDGAARGYPTSLALLLAKAAYANGGAVAWLDPFEELYLPAVSAAGIDLRRLILLRCADRKDQLWAVAECLRCRGVDATVAPVDRLNQVEARRLQLAAEQGGGIGIFMRPAGAAARACYAAATRWLIRPAPGGDRTQRWNVELIHGHGGLTHHALLLEVDRDTRTLRTSSPLADRPAAPTTARTTA